VPEKDKGDVKKFKTAGIKTEKEEKKKKQLWELDSDLAEDL
jgi:hypothetical protein